LIDPTNEGLFEQRFAALETARGWSPRVLSRLESAIRHGSDRDMFRINPLTFGTRFGIAEPEAIDLFVHSSAVGLFEMDWLLLPDVRLRRRKLWKSQGSGRQVLLSNVPLRLRIRPG